MKDPVYRAKCMEKTLKKHSSLGIMLGLADIAYDIFLLSLKQENRSITKEEIQHTIKELDEWKGPHQEANLHTRLAQNLFFLPLEERLHASRPIIEHTFTNGNGKL